jgi:hypothetical protein
VVAPFRLDTRASFAMKEDRTRRSRALPCALHVTARVRSAAERPEIELAFGNTGTAGAVFHVYDRKHLDRVPRRFTVEPDRSLTDVWQLGGDGGSYDLWLLGPAGFHRHVTGRVAGGSPAGSRRPALAERSGDGRAGARRSDVTGRRAHRSHQVATRGTPSSRIPGTPSRSPMAAGSSSAASSR